MDRARYAVDAVVIEGRSLRSVASSLDMIDPATEAEATEAPPQPTVVQGRFARDPSEFTIIKEAGR